MSNRRHVVDVSPASVATLGGWRQISRRRQDVQVGGVGNSSLSF